MNMVIYDSDKCIWKRDFEYDSLSMKEFDEYANIAATFVGYFIGKHDSISVEVNRIERKFRIIVEHIDKNSIYDYSISDFNAGYYKNGNMKWIDNFFGILNNEYGLAANNLRIPSYPTNSADTIYDWWKLYSQLRNFKIDFKISKNFPTVYDKIVCLKDKYFRWWG